MSVENQTFGLSGIRKGISFHLFYPLVSKDGEFPTIPSFCPQA